MNKNIIQFIVNENGQYVTIPVGRVKAKSNLTTRIQLVTPITASVAVNYLIYDSKNIEKKQYLIPNGELGSAVVDPNNPNYQLVAGWKVYEADIYAPILSVISKYKTGKVGMSFEFVKQVPNALCTNFVNYFGFTKELPEMASNGVYYICKDYNFWLNDKLYNKGDILVWYGEKWNNGGIIPNGLSETVDISVDPAISYPTEEVDETAFGNAIGELAEDVAELDTRLNGVETTITDKQDKVDLGLNTTDKTVVGAINEVKTQEEAHYNTLNTNKLDKNFNLLVERTFAQLSDWVAVRSGSDTLKMSLETLRTHLIQGLVGLSFQIVEELPTIGTSNVIYLTPIVNSIEDYETYEELPLSGIEQILYVVNDEHTGGTTGWYVWNGSNYVNYDLGFLEYIWLEEISKFELLGSTQVDLTDYYTKSQTDTLLNLKMDKSQIATALSSIIKTNPSRISFTTNLTDIVDKTIMRFYLVTNLEVTDDIQLEILSSDESKQIRVLTINNFASGDRSISYYKKFQIENENYFILDFMAFIQDEGSGIYQARTFDFNVDAENVNYNNEISELEATNVQDAIDELNSKIYSEITGFLEEGDIEV